MSERREGLAAATDQEIVALARAGHEPAYRELIRRYERPLFSLVFRMVRERELAEDLAQETFVKALNALDSYRPEFKFSTWIYKIAHNSAVDHLRRHAGRERSLVNGPEGDNYDLPIESGRLTPEQESEREERRLEIETVVKSLPSTYRELIVLRHSQDLTYEEIVDVTGLPLGTVKNRLFRAREMMRQIFIDRGIGSV